MRVVEAELPGVYIVEPTVFGDARGYFLESWSEKRYREAGIDTTFVQDNLSFSTRGVLRGLHYQKPHEQGKLVSVLLGEVFDVVVDIRVSSPTFGRWMGAVLSAENRRQLYAPPGFAHGFVVTSETALFSYKCTDYYSPADEGSVRWNDPDIGIQWPVSSPTLSPKDGAAPLLRDIPEERLFP